MNGSVRVPDGCELWPDVNAYVISQWAKDPSHSDKYYALKYAEEVLKLSHKDAEIFYEILICSAHAVLLGRGSNTDRYEWDAFWTRDDNIEYARIIGNLRNAIKAESLDLLLYEKKRSVDLWADIVNLAESLEDSARVKKYIVTTCRYGYYLYALYETMYRANAYALIGHHRAEVESAVEQYDHLWEKWENLYKTSLGCPTLYEKKDCLLDLIGYNWNKGFDSAITPVRDLDSDGRILKEHQIEDRKTNIWGLSGLDTLS